MKHKKLLAGCGAILALVLGSTALAAGTRSSSPTVTVRVEGLSHTLLAPTKVTVRAGWVTRFGAPKGDCPDRSAQGALDLATHHRWGGKWSTQFGPEYEITAILGEPHGFSSKYFWDIFVDNVPASAGACELKLHAGEHLLFAAVSQKRYATAYPLVIEGAPAHATVGRAFTVRVLGVNPHRSFVRVSGAHVSGERVSATTNSHAVATITPTKGGALELRAGKRGDIRSAPVTVHVS
jgi:hypothetical protein